MKIIYLVDARMPTDWAHGIQIMKMCEAFKKNGSDIELVVPKRFNKIKQDPFKYYDVSARFKITKIFCVDLSFLSSSKIIFLLQKFSFLASAKVYLLFKKYDILYTREPLSGIFFKNYILEIHVLPKKIKNFHVHIWKKARAIFVLTEFLKNKINNKIQDSEKILVLPDGVDVDKFNLQISKIEARKKIGLPLDKNIILYSGSLSLYDWKGVDILIESAKYIDNNTLILLVGGSETEIKQIKGKIKTSNILLVGRKPYAEIPYYLKASDALVLPNKKGDIMSEHYTSPLKLFEYMASSRPIIASDLPSLREVLNEDNCILVEPNSARDLAAGYQKVLNNEKVALEISSQSFKDVKNYSWQNEHKK